MNGKFWSDDFDMDLPKVLPDWEQCLGEAASVELRTYGHTTFGKLNHPAVWAVDGQHTAFCGLFMDACTPDGYVACSYELVSCTFAELVRDAWVHGYLARAQGIAVLNTLPLQDMFMEIMWHVRGVTVLPEETVQKYLDVVRQVLRKAAAKLLHVKKSCTRSGPWVFVTGGRDYDNRGHVFAVLSDMHAKRGIERIGHGACGWNADEPWRNKPHRLRGADRWADEWADENGVPVSRFPAHWTTRGKRGGPERDQAAFDTFVPNEVVRFPGDKGTANAVALARRDGIRVDDETADRMIHWVIQAGALPCFGTGTDVLLPRCDCFHSAEDHGYAPGDRHTECGECSCREYEPWPQWLAYDAEAWPCIQAGETSSVPMCNAEDMGGYPACSNRASLRTRDQKPKCYCPEHKINRHVFQGDLLDPIYASCLGEP